MATINAFITLRSFERVGREECGELHYISKGCQIVMNMSQLGRESPLQKHWCCPKSVTCLNYKLQATVSSQQCSQHLLDTLSSEPYGNDLGIKGETEVSQRLISDVYCSLLYIVTANLIFFASRREAVTEWIISISASLQLCCLYSSCYYIYMVSHLVFMQLPMHCTAKRRSLGGFDGLLVTLLCIAHGMCSRINFPRANWS